MVTDRLQLVPASVALCDAQLRGHAALTRALGATVPPSWPPSVFEPDDVERVRRQLTADSVVGIWTLHYVLLRATSGDGRRTLVGVAGYNSPPTDEGVVEIGYAIAEEYQRQGYATEAVGALVARAFRDHRVRAIAASTYATLGPSIGVLEKSGFREIARNDLTGLLRFELRRD